MNNQEDSKSLDNEGISRITSSKNMKEIMSNKNLVK